MKLSTSSGWICVLAFLLNALVGCVRPHPGVHRANPQLHHSLAHIYISPPDSVLTAADSSASLSSERESALILPPRATCCTCWHVLHTAASLGGAFPAAPPRTVCSLVTGAHPAECPLALPSSWVWWATNALNLVIMTLAGEYLCMRRELQDIPLFAPLRSRTS